MFFLLSLIKPLAYISVPILILRSTSPTARYYVNVGIYIGTLAVASAMGAVLGVLSVLSAGRWEIDVNYCVARTFYATAGRFLDIKIEVEGEEHLETRPALLLGNHQSMLDVLVLGRLFPRRTTIMAKKELRWTPLGPFMSLAGALFVDRGNSASAIQSLAEAGESMKHSGKSLWIFPEGTRSSSEQSTMLPFKKGGFHLATQAKIPIIPVVTENYWWLYRPGVFTSGTLKVRVLPPIPTTDVTTADVSSLATRVRELMVETLEDISVNVPLEPPARDEPTTTTSPPFPPLSSDSTPEAPTSPSPPSPPLAPPAIPIPEPEDSASTTTNSEPDADANGETGGAETLSESGSSFRKTDGSENGTETEEDEGMVLVGHPVRSE